MLPDYRSPSCGKQKGKADSAIKSLLGIEQDADLKMPHITLACQEVAFVLS
jgi:hypothetical protein